MRPRVRLALATLGIPPLLGVAYFAGIFLELEYPHSLVLWRVRSAHVSSGGTVNDRLAAAFGERAKIVHWHTCSYAAHEQVGSGEVHVQFQDPSDSDEFFEFIYTKKSHSLRPANARAEQLLATPTRTGG